MEVATAYCSPDQFLDAGLDHRAAPGTYLVDLQIVDIDAAHFMTL
jgi:hypothetical protein